jgi:hypothetical protein
MNRGFFKPVEIIIEGEKCSRRKIEGISQFVL